MRFRVKVTVELEVEAKGPREAANWAEDRLSDLEMRRDVLEFDMSEPSVRRAPPLTGPY